MKRILVVDDEKDVLDSLGSLLRRAGYGVTITQSGVEGLKLAQDDPPELIILDLMLPDMDGTEVASALLQHPQTREIPVIFLTSILTKAEQESSGTRIAKRCVIAKPCKGDEILAFVKEHIGPPV